MTVLLSTISLMTKWRKIIQEIVVLYINTESYRLAELGETGKLVKDQDGGRVGQSLSGSEESDCSLTDIPDKVQRTFIIIIFIITGLLCSLYRTIIIILAIKIIRDINMNNIESCTNTRSSYQVGLVGEINIRQRKGKYLSGSHSRPPG